ncbi:MULTISPECIES: hypothetical protein [unclassified Nostoc]|uniref:hypothetical protein n=1 Tax=unclassified Nostoc TaxID=2593658 RepID=UPI00261A2AD2|nr:hypothetical protein [Nostoc sp. S13]MDF5738376.1 hypothetical protein [Nostoc sp. S13]
MREKSIQNSGIVRAASICDTLFAFVEKKKVGEDAALASSGAGDDGDEEQISNAPCQGMSKLLFFS